MLVHCWSFLQGFDLPMVPFGRRMPLVRVNPRNKWSGASENWTEGCQKWHENRIQCTAYGVDAHHICQSGRCTAKFLGGKIEASGLSEPWSTQVQQICLICYWRQPGVVWVLCQVKFLLQVKVWKWLICSCFLVQAKRRKAEEQERQERHPCSHAWHDLRPPFCFFEPSDVIFCSTDLARLWRDLIEELCARVWGTSSKTYVLGTVYIIIMSII